MAKSNSTSFIGDDKNFRKSVPRERAFICIIRVADIILIFFFFQNYLKKLNKITWDDIITVIQLSYVSCFCRIKVENFLQLSGLVVGGIGIWTVVAKHSYVSLMSTSTYPTLAYALIVAGVLAVIGSWLGCGGVTSENRCVLLVVSPKIIHHCIVWRYYKY